MPATLELLRAPSARRPACPSRRDQADRHLDVHRLQGLRGGVPGVERPAAGNHGADGHVPRCPDMSANFWNLIKFREHEENGALQGLMRKDQCMHCAEPGCLAACPAPGAIVQYTNGIVDFQQDQCIGCGYCITGCPFDVPKIHTRTKRLQVHAVRGPCRRRPAARLREGVSDQLPAVRDEGRDARHRHQAGRAAAGERFPNAAVYDPPASAAPRW